MFDQATILAVNEIARTLKVEPAALLAVATVESAGRVFALVNGREEPLIRFEGHYFDRRISGEKRAQARAAGLASPKAGKIANPATQAARWALLARAAEIDHVAAYESVSWGVGQVMGAHWQWLRFNSVDGLVSLARRDAAGQIELMAKFIDKAGLAGALRALDWTTFARGYNGPAYKTNNYDRKMAEAYRKAKGIGLPVIASDRSVRRMQEMLVAKGYQIQVDGIRGPKTDKALRKFQKMAGLAVDGICGPKTWAALADA